MLEFYAVRPSARHKSGFRSMKHEMFNIFVLELAQMFSALVVRTLFILKSKGQSSMLLWANGILNPNNNATKNGHWTVYLYVYLQVWSVLETHVHYHSAITASGTLTASRAVMTALHGAPQHTTSTVTSHGEHVLVCLTILINYFSNCFWLII